MQNNSTSEHSSNSAAVWPSDAFPPLASLAAAIGLAAVALVSTLALVELFRVSPGTLRHPELTTNLVAVQLFDYVPVVVYVAIVLPRLAGRPLAEIFGPFRPAALAGVLDAFVMLFCVVGIGSLQAAILHQEQHQLAVRLFQSARPGIPLAIMLVAAVVLGPIVEELVFRGFIFNALRRRMPFWPAAAFSGLLFGAAHGELAGVFPLAAGGIVLAVVYARTGSLWTSIVTHGSFNAMTLAFVMLSGNRA